MTVPYASRFFSLAAVVCLCACHSSAPGSAAPAAQTAKLPVTQVVQTFNRPYDQAWPVLLNAMKEKDLNVKVADPGKGELLTDWVELEDELCGSYPLNHAPLSCRVRFLLKAQRISERASSFALSYLEECYDQKAVNLECPGSNAEKMLFDVAEHLKQKVGAR